VSRSAGVGRFRLSGAEKFARDCGFDTVKIAVMHGNARALAFYEPTATSSPNPVLYRRLEGK
jgi:hypothetical protein